jgi:hypothetical protein
MRSRFESGAGFGPNHRMARNHGVVMAAPKRDDTQGCGEGADDQGQTVAVASAAERKVSISVLHVEHRH